MLSFLLGFSQPFVQLLLPLWLHMELGWLVGPVRLLVPHSLFIALWRHLAR
jgi:hypothetical protein